MLEAVLDLLRCPATGERLEFTTNRSKLRAAISGNEYPIVRGVPRFVPADNYATSFGLQWNHFRKTQLDSHSGVPISRDRFYKFTGWKPEELRGKRVLDVGCGAGRFTEIALAAGARVVAVDYSSAVDACMENHGSNPNLIVLQADLYRLPLAPESFDYVYCLGVLQHTPDVRAAFFSLIRYIRPGGHITIDVYPKLLRNLLWCKYWLRPITKRMPAEQLFRVVGWMTPVLLRMSDALRRVPVAGRHLRYALPVVNYRGVYPLSEAQLREWAVLDTFDMLSPAHDHPQSIQTVERWLREAGLEDRVVKRIGFNVGRGRKPQAVEQVSCAS